MERDADLHVFGRAKKNSFLPTNRASLVTIAAEFGVLNRRTSSLPQNHEPIWNVTVRELYGTLLCNLHVRYVHSIKILRHHLGIPNASACLRPSMNSLAYCKHSLQVGAPKAIAYSKLQSCLHGRLLKSVPIALDTVRFGVYAFASKLLPQLDLCGIRFGIFQYRNDWY